MIGATDQDQQPLRVALLRGDDHHNRYLEELLRSMFDVVATVVEPGISQRRALRRRGKWRDAVAAEYHQLRRTVLGLNRYRRRFFDEPPPGTSPLSEAPNRIIVDSINESVVGKTVRSASPDICVISCVTILSAETINAIGTDILNIHGGHLPDYRGCHCFFFALYDGAFDKIGSTIHFVDAGIDTGDIVEVVRPAIRPSDNAEKLYCRAERLAAHRVSEWLRALERGEHLPRTPQAFRGRLCLRRDRGPQHDIRFAMRRLLGRVRLPDVADFERWEPPAAP